MLPALEKRKCIRHDFAVKVAIRYIARSSGDDLLEGFLANKSLSGLCLFTLYPLTIGEEIRIKKNVYIPFQKAEVKWIKELKKQWHAVGLIGTN